jgi:hypothetical protein
MCYKRSSSHEFLTVETELRLSERDPDWMRSDVTI